MENSKITCKILWIITFDFHKEAIFICNGRSKEYMHLTPSSRRRLTQTILNYYHAKKIKIHNPDILIRRIDYEVVYD